MLKSSNKYLIVFDKKEEKDRYVDYVINSAKVSFSQMKEFTKVENNKDNEKIKRCKSCTAVLHVRVRVFLLRTKTGCGTRTSIETIMSFSTRRSASSKLWSRAAEA